MTQETVNSNEFSGLPIENLIGGPLEAAANAQILLAQVISNFIQEVGFVKKETITTTITIADDYSAKAEYTKIFIKDADIHKGDNQTKIDEKLNNYFKIKISDYVTTNTENNSELDYSTCLTTNTNRIKTYIDTVANIQSEDSAEEKNKKIIKYMTKNETSSETSSEVRYVTFDYQDGDKDKTLEIPFLALVNVPSLKVNNVDITFNMDVKSATEDNSKTAAESSLSVGENWGDTRVNFQGSVSALKESTQTTDTSAKYTINVTASDPGMPEGLSRVLDILTANAKPVDKPKVEESKK